MNIFKWLLLQAPLVMSLVLVPVINASATDIPVYKGVLRVLIVPEREGNTLLLQYRTKTRQVLRSRGSRSGDNQQPDAPGDPAARCFGESCSGAG